jgi:putative ABC transport system substrate-binding protein
MRRRSFLTLIGGAAALAPLTSYAQQIARTYRIGGLVASGRQAPHIIAFFDELRTNGFIEGQNLEVLPEGFGFRNEQLPPLAASLIEAAPDVLLAGGAIAIRRLQQGTQTIPVVAVTEDMVADGLVNSFARPGGNITGVSLLSPELDGKRQEVLIEAVPGIKHLTILADANTTPPKHTLELQEQARRRGVECSILSIASPEQLVSAMESIKSSGSKGINVLAGPLLGSYPNRRAVIDHANRLRMPAIYQWPEMAEEGGLAAYGPRFADVFRQMARQVVRVLHGAKPSQLPVEQPTRFELVLNLKTAKLIGHEIPASLVLRADKVIE